MTSENPLHALPVERAGPAAGIAGVATVLLHGRGRSPAEMLAVGARLTLPTMPFVALTAVGGTWYPESFLAARDRNEPHLGWALERVEAAVRMLEDEGVSRERIALVGFSQGACLAAEYVFRRPARWGALLALTGGLIGPPGTSWTSDASLAGTPVLLTTSDVDEWVPLERVKETADVFRAMGADVHLRVCPGRGHLVSDEELQAAREQLVTLLEKAGVS
jgi:phospholipase/carboxylesterase